MTVTRLVLLLDRNLTKTTKAKASFNIPMLFLAFQSYFSYYFW